MDDLERILEADPGGGRHRVKPANAPVQRAVLRAFEAAMGFGNSRLVITSRFPFALDGLERRLLELHLAPLSEAAQRKLELQQKEAAEGAYAESTDYDVSSSELPFQKHLQELKELSKDLHPRVFLEAQRSIVDNWLKSRGLSGLSAIKRKL
jgi:hypothetical protein